MSIRSLMLAACVFCLGFGSVATAATWPQLGGNDSSTRREAKRLHEVFGLVLPDSANVTSVLKTPQTKITYLLIQMSSDDGLVFKERLNRGPSPGHPKIMPSVENADCVAKDGVYCTSIGSLNVPSDYPDDILDKWYEANSFKSDTIASYRTLGFKKFASMFMDSKKGLLVLWYKA